MYRLTKHKLITTKKGTTEVPFWILLKDLFSPTQCVQLWIGKHGFGYYTRVHVSHKNFIIGCRRFSKRTFASIIRAAKAAK